MEVTINPVNAAIVFIFMNGLGLWAWFSLRTQLKEILLVKDEFHGEWNYSILPKCSS